MNEKFAKISFALGIVNIILLLVAFLAIKGAMAIYVFGTVSFLNFLGIIFALKGMRAPRNRIAKISLVVHAGLIVAFLLFLFFGGLIFWAILRGFSENGF